MKKLVLKNYDIEVPVRKEDGTTEKKKIEYNVRESLIAILTDGQLRNELKIGGREALLQDKLANKIEDCKEDFILLEAQDYEKITRVADAFHSWRRFDGQLLERVFEAETVEVEEKK